jgi:hypothetical protein
MAIHARMGGARAKSARLVLGLAFLWASCAANADDSYTFTLTPLSGNGANASGTFTLQNISNTSIALVTSVNASLYFDGDRYIFDQVLQGSNIRPSPIGVGVIFLGSGSSLAFYGTPSVTSTEIRGAVNTIIGTTTNSYYNGASIFDAILTSTSGSGNGSSGGAPAPEVNAALGLVIAGATVVFLRRRRGSRSEAAAAS